MADVFDKKTRSRIMSKIRGKNTKPELRLAAELRRAGLRLSRHAKLPGTPDFASRKYKVAVFVDGEFWHGYNWKVLGRKPPRGFWQKKILRNMARDKRNNQDLHRVGWRIVRLRETFVTRKPKYCLRRIRSAMRDKK